MIWLFFAGAFLMKLSMSFSERVSPAENAMGFLVLCLIGVVTFGIEQIVREIRAR